MSVSDKDIEQQLAEHRVKRKEVKAAERKEAKAIEKQSQGENTLVVERDPGGLYWVRYKHQGIIPEALKGRFSSRFKLEAAARAVNREHLLEWQ